MREVPISLSVAGRLDTANPRTNRPDSTLVEATDLAHRFWGPRRRLTQRTWAYKIPSASYPNPQTWIFDGNNSQVTGAMRTREQFNLPTAWTVDLIIRPSGVSHSADVNLPILRWDFGASLYAFEVGIKGGGASAGSQRAIYATVTPTSSAGVAGTTRTLTGTTQQSVGTALKNTHHIHLVRDGATATLSVDGVQEAQATNVSATQRHESSTGVTGSVSALLAAGTGGGNHLYAGRILAAVVRVGAFTDPLTSFRDLAAMRHSCTRFAVYGVSTRDHSLYDTPLTASSTTQENVTEPSPWFSPAIQAGAYYVDIFGTAWNAVLIHGTLTWRRVG